MNPFRKNDIDDYIENIKALYFLSDSTDRFSYRCGIKNEKERKYLNTCLQKFEFIDFSQKNVLNELLSRRDKILFTLCILQNEDIELDVKQITESGETTFQLLVLAILESEYYMLGGEIERLYKRGYRSQASDKIFLKQLFKQGFKKQVLLEFAFICRVCNILDDIRDIHKVLGQQSVLFTLISFLMKKPIGFNFSNLTSVAINAIQNRRENGDLILHAMHIFGVYPILMANDNKNTLSRKIDEFHKFKPIQDNEFRDIINVIFPALSLKDTRKKIQLYSDGGADPNPGKGGYGIILSFNGKKKELSQGYKLTTNNRMELLGIITGLNQIKESAIVEIYTDSKYVINGIEKGWAKKWKANNWYRTSNEKAINSDLWNKLLDAIIRHETMFYWVKGHNGHLENERCDELATLALNSRNLIEDKGYIPNDNTPVIINPTIKTAYSQNNIKMTHEGQPCRKCETPVEKKIPKRKKLKPHQSYYYEYYLNCPNCRCIYHLEEAKRYVKD